MKRTCSICGYTTATTKAYCPSCGADWARLSPGDRMSLLCKAARSSVGLSVTVLIVRVLPRPKGTRKTSQEVEVRLPGGVVTTVWIGDLSGPHTREVDCDQCGGWNASSAKENCPKCKGIGIFTQTIED